MTDEEFLAELLLEWENRHERGENVSTVDLCPDRPDLVPILDERIASLGRLAWLNADDQPCEPTVPAPVPEEPLSGRYRCDQKIGEGGHGQVYKAYDMRMKRTVAVKIPRSDFHRLRPDRRDAFVEEARLLAQFSYPGIVRVYDVGQHNGQDYIVTEWIDGIDLAERLRGGDVTVREAVRIVAEVARHLHYAHERGFIHRDIKPANILLQKDGQVLVTDFGIALQAGAEGRAGGATGTINYMSPERLAGSAGADVRVDVYALGVVFYELLTGRPPFSEPSRERLQRAILDGELAQPLQLHTRGIHLHIIMICERCMERNPANRYQSVEEVAEALGSWMADLDNFEAGSVVDMYENIRRHNVKFAAALANRGSAYANKKRFDEAIVDYTEAIRLDPNLAVAYINRANSYVEKGEYDKAIVDYTEAIRLDPHKYSEKYITRKYQHPLEWELGRLKPYFAAVQSPTVTGHTRAGAATIEDYSVVIRHYPRFALAWYNRGTAYEDSTVYGQAIADYSEAIRLDPQFAPAHARRGKLYLKSKDYDRAIADFTEAIRLDLNSAASFYGRGTAYYGKREYEEAIADLTEAIRLDPNSASAFYLRSDAYRERHEFDRAIEDYSKAVLLDQCAAHSFHLRGHSYSEKQEYTEAIMEYTEAIRLDPNSATFFFSRGTAYSAKQDYERAIADFTEAIRRDPTFVLALDARKDATDKKQRCDQGTTAPTEVIRLDPNSATFFFSRGTAYSAKQDYERAIADFTEAIRRDPTCLSFFCHRGDAYNEKKEYDKAITDFTQAIRLDPNSAYSFGRRGDAYGGKREYDKAILDYTEAIRFDPTCAAYFFDRGFTYREMQKYDQAIKDFAEVIRLDPKNPYATSQLILVYAVCRKHGVWNDKNTVELGLGLCELAKRVDSFQHTALAAASAEAALDGVVEGQVEPPRMELPSEESSASVRHLGLISLNAASEGRVWWHSAPVEVGRNGGRFLSELQQPSLSRRHARLSYDAAGWWVADLGSTHGTWLNGTRIGGEPTGPLQAGDIIHFSHVAFFVTFSPASANGLVVSSDEIASPLAEQTS